MSEEDGSEDASAEEEALLFVSDSELRRGEACGGGSFAGAARSLVEARVEAAGAAV